MLHPELRPTGNGNGNNYKRVTKEVNHIARRLNKPALEVIEYKIKQLKQAKAACIKEANSTEIDNIEVVVEDNSSDEEMAEVSLQKPILRKKTFRVKAKKERPPPTTTIKKKTKRKILDLQDTSDEESLSAEQKSFEEEAMQICEDTSVYSEI